MAEMIEVNEQAGEVGVGGFVFLESIDHRFTSLLVDDLLNASRMIESAKRRDVVITIGWHFEIFVRQKWH